MKKSFNSAIYEKYINKENLPVSLIKVEALLDKENGNKLELFDVKAEILNLMGRVDEAIQIYEQILETDDEYINTYIALSNLYLVKEIKEEKNYSSTIVRLLKKVEEINPTELPCYVLAGALKDSGNLDEAFSYYIKALKQEENDSFFLENIYSGLANIFVAQKKYTLALNAYDNIIKRSTKEHGDDSNCSEVYAAKREIYSILGDNEKIREMDRKFASAENRYDNNSFSKYYTGEWKNIHDRIKKLGEQERGIGEKLFQMTLLTVKERYFGGAPDYNQLEEVINSVLDEVEYDEDIRMIEKARLFKRFNEQYDKV